MNFADNNFSHSAGSCKQFSIKRHAEKKQIKLLKGPIPARLEKSSFKISISIQMHLFSLKLLIRQGSRLK